MSVSFARTEARVRMSVILTRVPVAMATRAATVSTRSMSVRRRRVTTERHAGI